MTVFAGVAPVREYLGKLTGAGMTIGAIAAASGVPRSTILGIARGETGRVLPRTAAGILAVPVPEGKTRLREPNDSPVCVNPACRKPRRRKPSGYFEGGRNLCDACARRWRQAGRPAGGFAAPRCMKVPREPERAVVVWVRRPSPPPARLLAARLAECERRGDRRGAAVLRERIAGNGNPGAVPCGTEQQGAA